MRIALLELRRRPGRFVTASIILTLIALLLLFLGGLLDGLINTSTAALRAQRGDLIVYSSTSESSFVRSRIDPSLRQTVAAVPGVTEVGGIGVAQLGARVPGNGPRDLADVALFGYEIPPTAVDEPPADGEVIADEVLKSDGVEQGMVLELGPARTPVTVVGFTTDTSFNGQGSLWGSAATWRDVQNANRPDAAVADGVFQSLVVVADGSVAPGKLAADIDAATAGATDTLTITAAIDAIPGVTEQRGVFNQILGVTVLIAVVVVALFFALLTVERTGLYGVLKAIGGRSRTLFGGLVLQAVVVTLIAAAIGGGLALLLDVAIPPGALPFDLSVGRIVLSVLLLLFAAVIGCAFSLRRVLRVDPASAIGSAS